jgi:NADH-quinone oxidoreductase subunit J
MVLGRAASASKRCRRRPAVAGDYSNTKALGVAIYTDYVYPFELASVILLVAMIAASC